MGGISDYLTDENLILWQAEFCGGNWLAEVHYDLDCDGLPGKLDGKSRKDSFSNQSVCRIAMTLNQSIINARVLMMPNMQCDEPKLRMSVFLSAETYRQALRQFIRAARKEGFIVKQESNDGVLFVLVGNPEHH